MTGQQVLDWLKSNFLIVIFAVLIIAAFVALPIISSGMQKSVDEIKDQRARTDQQLTQLRQTAIDLKDPTPGFEPPSQTAALINPAALKELTEYTEEREQEADAMLSTAVQFNRKGRGVLVPALFPDPAQSFDEPRLLKEMSAQLRSAYQSLLNRVNAGQPPNLEDMKDALILLDQQFRNKIASTDDRENLTSQELTELRKQLSDRRLGLATQAASNIGIYCSLDVLNPPSWEEGQTKPSSVERFQWQWDYWITADLFEAIRQTNGNSTSTVRSPVKRIKAVSIESLGVESAAREQRGGRTRTPGGGRAGGGPHLSGGDAGTGGAPSGGNQRRPTQPREDEEPQQPAGGTVDPTTEVQPDYSTSFTGRHQNGLYDVRVARLHVIVETAKIPDLLDAIGGQNFMTVTGMELWPADPFADLEAGYVYGNVPTSELILDIETVWLRSWTAPFMPRALKQEWGIPIETAAETGGRADP